MTKRYRIAVIAGDGIGKEVVPEGVRVLDAAATKFGFDLHWDCFPWSGIASVFRTLSVGGMMTSEVHNGKEAL